MPEEENPHPHIDVFGGPTVTVWPDGVVGIKFASGANFLLDPYEAEATGWALLRMARAARPAFMELQSGPGPSGPKLE